MLESSNHFSDLFPECQQAPTLISKVLFLIFTCSENGPTSLWISTEPSHTDNRVTDQARVGNPCSLSCCPSLLIHNRNCPDPNGQQGKSSANLHRTADERSKAHKWAVRWPPRSKFFSAIAIRAEMGSRCSSRAQLPNSKHPFEGRNDPTRDRERENLVGGDRVCKVVNCSKFAL